MAISWEETKATTEQLLQEAVAFTAVSAEDFRTHRGIYILSYCGQRVGRRPMQTRSRKSCIWAIPARTASGTGRTAPGILPYAAP